MMGRMLPAVRLVLLVLLAGVLPGRAERERRLLDFFSISLSPQEEAVFELREADPHLQATAFCAKHNMSAPDCTQLASEAETQFFHHQWLLHSTSFELRQPSGEKIPVEFKLYTGLAPALQAQRFCEKYSLSHAECLPLMEAASKTFYKLGSLIEEKQLELALSASQGSPTKALTVNFNLYDNLSPSDQAYDFCIINEISRSACGNIVSLAETLYYPYLTSVYLSLPEEMDALHLELQERSDPVISALEYCNNQNLSPAICDDLVQNAEDAYYESLDGGYFILREKFAFPGAKRECHLYDRMDPYMQALRCCDLNQISISQCGQIITAVTDMFFTGQTPLVTFQDSDRNRELRLFSSLDPFTQVISFCRKFDISLEGCHSVIEKAEKDYFEATGPLLLPISLEKPFKTLFNLYMGRDPVLQTKWFCRKNHFSPTNCDMLIAHSFKEYISRGDVVTRISIDGISDQLVLYDNLGPQHQAKYFCSKHKIPPDKCVDIIMFSIKEFFKSGDLISSIPVTVRNSVLTLDLFHNVDPVLQVNAFCNSHRLTKADCTFLLEFAIDTFQKAGSIIDIIHLYIPSSSGGDMDDKVVNCYDNLDPMIQAQNLCDRFSMSLKSCQTVVDTFEATFFHAGDIINNIMFSDKPFPLRENVDPFTQASRFCKRNHISQTLCEPLVEYSEIKYFDYGDAINVFKLTAPDAEEVFSFTLYDKYDPIEQAERFCKRVGMTNCSALISSAEKIFFEERNMLGRLTISSTDENSTSTFILYSNLDPAVQAHRFCFEHSLPSVDCNVLVESAEKIYFRAGEAISHFIYQHQSKNFTFVLYNHVDPLFQLKRFFRTNSIPLHDRPSMTDAMLEKFYDAGNLIQSLNVTLHESATEVQFNIYDNLDPFPQADNFCSKHVLSPTFCNDIISVAEQHYFNSSLLGSFKFAISDVEYQYNYFDLDMREQVSRFCFVHKFTSKSCDMISEVVKEQAEVLRQEQEKADLARNEDSSQQDDDKPDNSEDIVIEL